MFVFGVVNWKKIRTIDFSTDYDLWSPIVRSSKQVLLKALINISNTLSWFSALSLILRGEPDSWDSERIEGKNVKFVFWDEYTESEIDGKPRNQVPEEGLEKEEGW